MEGLIPYLYKVMTADHRTPHTHNPPGAPRIGDDSTAFCYTRLVNDYDEWARPEPHQRLPANCALSASQYSASGGTTKAEEWSSFQPHISLATRRRNL
uniref:Uncharacterized protein n=1 Tax=Nelumbo nucifera TaxID=4432 RepID=A0A822YGP9_NELNU|nr:TPA_asm: hypothetical protein HUJ06_030116 [Nelumbo nucifera]